MDQSPRLSVIMSVFNAENFIEKAIQSILRQEYEDFEFIIIEDGSTDRSREIIRSWSDPRIRFFENTRNNGLIFSLNRAIDLAAGTYIARMDADDLSFPKRFTRQMDYLENHPETGVVGTAMNQVDVLGRPISILSPPLTHAQIFWKMHFACPIYHPTVMARKEQIVRAGKYNPAFTHVEDTELWSRMIHVCGFSNLSEVLYTRRWHADSICNRYGDIQEKADVEIRHLFWASLLNTSDCRNSVAEIFRQLDPEKSIRNSREKSRHHLELLLDLTRAFIIRYHPEPSDCEYIRNELTNLLARVRFNSNGKFMRSFLPGFYCRLDAAREISSAGIFSREK